MNPAIQMRIDEVRQSLASRQIDGLLVLVGENRRYLSGFEAEDTQFDESAGALLIFPDHLVLATDSRYELEARHQAAGYEVMVYQKGLEQVLPDLIADRHVNRLAFESVRMTVAQLDTIRSAVTDRCPEVELVPIEDTVEALRRIKEPEEIDAIRRALHMAEAGLEQMKPDISEATREADAAWALEKKLRESGAEELSFPMIVAAGPNSALPHAVPGQRRFAGGEPLLFDWGVRLNGYCSDISRTLILGSPDTTFKKVFQTVLDAQEKAIDAIRPGITGKAVDAVARQHIADSGFGEYFGHGLGHGVGLAIHEGPRLSPVREDILEPGMVFTVEPGIYLPDWGGVRLENMVALHDDGPEVLNRTDPGEGYIL